MRSALLTRRFVALRLFSATLIAAAAMTTVASTTDAASVTCPNGQGLQQVYNIHIDILDRTLDTRLGRPRNDFDVLTLVAANCTVGGVLDGVAGLATTSWSPWEPHPYALVATPGGKWRNANAARHEPLVEGARFWYPLLGRWTAAFGTDQT